MLLLLEGKSSKNSQAINGAMLVPNSRRII